MGTVATNSRSFTAQTACSTHGLYYNMDSGLFQNLIFFLALIVSLTVHEFFHAFLADRFGDPTPRSYGRVSLNPLKHLDPLGTIMLFLVHFGWGKPVPIDPYNLSRKEETLVALAGPVSNLLLAVIASIALHFYFHPILFVLIQTNVVLAVFNLLPLPPLDGSKVILNLLPPSESTRWQQAFDQYGYVLLAVLLFLPFGSSNIINQVISPLINLILRFLI